MKTLARFAVVVGIAVGMTACLGPKEMPVSNLTPEHAKWIADVTPILGTWLGGIENEDAWVDGFRTERELILLAACARDRTARLSVRPADGPIMIRRARETDMPRIDQGPGLADRLAARRDRVLALYPHGAVVDGCEGTPSNGLLPVECEVTLGSGSSTTVSRYRGVIVVDYESAMPRPSPRPETHGPE